MFFGEGWSTETIKSSLIYEYEFERICFSPAGYFSECCVELNLFYNFQNLRSEPPTARVPSRFTTSHYRGEKPIPSSNAMTRSVFGSLTSSTSANNNKQQTSPRRKPSAVKKQTRSPLSSTTSTKSAPQPLMTQSLYSCKLIIE